MGTLFQSGLDSTYITRLPCAWCLPTAGSPPRLGFPSRQVCVPCKGPVSYTHLDVYKRQCADRVRLGRALQQPPITQEELAMKIQLLGFEDMTKLIISRIEKNQRHVCDAELRILAKALNVSMEWLVGDVNIFE